ncbi:MAG: cytochrome c3 family protein [Chloroflexota bacterium]
MNKSKKKVIKKRPVKKSLDKRIQYFLGGVAILAILALAAMFTGTQLENKNSFCASCHTEGEQTFYNQSLAADPVDLASFHENKNASRCIDCHTGNGPVGRFFGLLAGASDLVSFYSGKYPQPAVLEEAFPDQNCTKCHDTIAVKQDMSNHFHALLSKWQSTDPNAAACVSCHNGHKTNGDSKIKFLNETDTTKICQKCHAIAGEG